MRRRHLAVELLKGELATRRRKNVVQARSFAEMLEQTIRRCQNRAVEAAQVIEELIGLAREMREANARGEALGLSDDLAFYDALGVNDSAVRVLGDDTLRHIARELVETVRNNLVIDWTRRENVRANLRRLVKRVLRKHDYPPDKSGIGDANGAGAGRGVVDRLGGVRVSRYGASAGENRAARGETPHARRPVVKSRASMNWYVLQCSTWRSSHTSGMWRFARFFFGFETSVVTTVRRAGSRNA